MKTIVYNEDVKLDIMEPLYNGYLSKFSKTDNKPENCQKDFADYMIPRNVVKYKVVGDDKYFNEIGGYTLEIPDIPMYEKIFLCTDHLVIKCAHADYLIYAVATVIANTKTKGMCVLAYKFVDILYDYIMLLKYAFGVVKISTSFIICDGFSLKESDKKKILNYFRYAIDCDKTVYPFKIVDMKLKKLFEMLF